jgi:flagellar biosynthesis/type III secretory pathway protein FliH
MNDLPERYQLKREMIRDLFQRGMPVKKVSKILSLIDWLMILPEDLEKQFNTELQAQQKTNTMIPISSFELAVLEQGIEKGLERGRQEGRQEGNRKKAQEDVLDVLETRFGEISDLVREQVQSLTDAIELKRLLRRAILVSDLNSFSAEFVVPVG